MALFENFGTHAAAERAAASGGYGLPAAAQNEDMARAAHLSTGTHAAAEHRGHGFPVVARNAIGAGHHASGARAAVHDENASLSLSFGPHAASGARDGSPSAEKDENGVAHVQFGVPFVGMNENGFSQRLTSARPTGHNEKVFTGAHATAEQGAASLGHGSPAPAQNAVGARAAVDNKNDAAYLFSGARAVIDSKNDVAYLFSGARPAIDSKNDAAYLFSGARSAIDNKNGAAYLVSGARAADWMENGALSLFTGPGAALQQAAAHRGYGLPSVTKDENGAANGHVGVPIAGMNENGVEHLLLSCAGGKMVLFKTRTAAAETQTGAAYYSSGMVATGGDLPQNAQVLPGGPAAVIGRRKDGGSFAERMRGGLPVVGLALAGAAATGLATGAATPVTGFTMFMILLGGLSLFTAHVLRA